ncbi:ATP-binding cassette domain-containing protein [Facilibium subflavum]|uniref:ATP-binding cassette domain-containing protein n=1 Tax=Facilibium subflavum TaxID=2219058 RepID=UPI000E659A55|nr:ABC transporter ATP-binding protein [Facilibium subflavum]
MKVRLFTNKFFLAALALIILQQILIGGSTYFIALAGMSVSLQQVNAVMNYIILFFVSVAVAYSIGSTALFLTTKLANDLWRRYTLSLLSTVGGDMSYSSQKNKLETNHWIGGEALATIDSASEFVLDFISLYCNILFTLLAFLFTLGWVVTGAVCFALVISSLLLTFTRSRIQMLGSEIQSKKLTVLSGISLLWDFLFYAPQESLQKKEEDVKLGMQSFFLQKEKYKFHEQILSCIPIFIAIPIVIIATSYALSHKLVLIGALVATLPRSLQMFQNLHAVSMYNSRIALTMKMLSNLASFDSRLERQELSKQINKSQISIAQIDRPGDNTHSVDSLFNLINEDSTKGRYLINGPNGAGKSSFLKLIKSQKKDSIYIGPEVHFNDVIEQGSTGQRRVSSILELLDNLSDKEILLLDEWDANLDIKNKNIVCKSLSETAKTHLIIEVRH